MKNSKDNQTITVLGTMEFDLTTSNIEHVTDGVKSYITDNIGLTITDCPSNPDDVDMELVQMAVDCHFDKYHSYGVMVMAYDNIIESVGEILNYAV